MSKKIKVSISQEGEVTIEASGFHGEGCAETTGPLEEALGMDPTARELKPEYHETVSVLEVDG